MTDSAVALELRLDHGTSFEPGARLSGVAVWGARTAPVRLELELSWTSRGPGGRDLKIVETLTFADPQAEERRPFIIALPAAPYTFRGALISLAWTLQLTAHPSQESTRVDLTIAPGRQVIDLR